MVACAFRHCLIATFYIVPTLWLPAFWATAHIVWTTQPRIWNRQDRSWWPLFRLAWGHHCDMVPLFRSAWCRYVDMVALFRSVWWQGGPYWDWHCRTFRLSCLCPIYQLVWHLLTSLTNQMEHKTDLSQDSKWQNPIQCCLKNTCFGKMWTQIEDSCTIWATQQTYQVLICVKTISRIIAKHSVRATRQV